MTLTQDEILELLKKQGARIEPIVRHCKFQRVFDTNIFDYCYQTGNSDYAWNLGSGGGPVISCEGAPTLPTGSHKEIIEGGVEMLVIDYAPAPPPCPHYIEKGEVIGWKILLPNSTQ